MKIIALLLSLFVFISGSMAQTEFELPDNIVLEAKEDYAKYDSVMVQAANWLETTDLDKEKPMRKDVSAFVFRWVAGSPTVNLDIFPVLMDLVKKNEELLAIYFASYSRYCIEHKSVTDYRTAAIRAGLQSIIKVYQKGVSISKNKDMLKLIKKNEEGGLDAYIEEKFHKQ